jgi:hypothetical protein
MSSKVTITKIEKPRQEKKGKQPKNLTGNYLPTKILRSSALGKIPSYLALTYIITAALPMLRGEVWGRVNA